MVPLTAMRQLAEALSIVPGIATIEILDDGESAAGVRVICAPGADPTMVSLGVRRVMATDPTLDVLGVARAAVDVVEDVPVRAPLALVGSGEYSNADPFEQASTRFRHPSQGAFVTSLVELAHTERPIPFELLRLEVVRGRQSRVDVVLSRGGTPTTGQALVTAEGVALAVATATVKAATAHLERDGDLFVVAAGVSTLGALDENVEVATVAVRFSSVDGTSSVLIGSTQVVGDVRESVVRATLDAVNRRPAPRDQQPAHNDRMNG